MTRPVTPNASAAELLDVERQLDRRRDPILAVLRVEGRRLEGALEVLALAVQLVQVEKHGVGPARPAGGNPSLYLESRGSAVRGSRFGGSGSRCEGVGSEAPGCDRQAQHPWHRGPRESGRKSRRDREATATTDREIKPADPSLGRTATHGLGMNSCS